MKMARSIAANKSGRAKRQFIRIKKKWKAGALPKPSFQNKIPTYRPPDLKS